MRRVLDGFVIGAMASLGVLAGLSGATLTGAEASQAQEDSTEIVAAAVRERGHVCQNPERALPDPQDTTPDEKAWRIRCESGDYRVKFMGSEGAKVERLND